MNEPVKILIVDDEKNLRSGIKRLLEGEGFFVDTAENGTEGINLGTENDYSAAIIDLKMPDVDGLQVLKEIKNVRPNTICLISTAYASYENAVDAIKFGAYSYIPKPFNSDELLETLYEGLSKRNILIQAENWRKEREEKLLEVAFEKTRLNTIINSMAEGVLVVNKNGQVVLFNPCTLRFLKLNNIEIEQQVNEVVPVPLNELIKTVLNSEGEKIYSKEITIDENLIIDATASPVPNHKNGLAGVVVVLRNITELKKIETIKSQFVSMVSHELKAPISAVYGFLQLLSDKSITLTDDQKSDFLTRSKVRLDGLLKLVNDLLDISRVEMKTVQRELKDINLKESVKFVIDTLQGDIRRKQVKINLHLQDNLPPLKADEEEMNRVFTNLIGNAVKYNKSNGSIDISISTRENQIIIEIKDTGIGLKEEDTNKLFQEFFRVKNEYTKNISGTGLGLTIVRRIVDSYSGKIEVESEYGTGTSFKIFFPVLANK